MYMAISKMFGVCDFRVTVLCVYFSPHVTLHQTPLASPKTGEGHQRQPSDATAPVAPVVPVSEASQQPQGTNGDTGLDQ